MGHRRDWSRRCRAGERKSYGVSRGSAADGLVVDLTMGIDGWIPLRGGIDSDERK